MHDLIIIGGGAAGIFAAITAKAAHPSLKVLVLEKTAVLLSKVRISGGGRCNVTHACFDPHILTQNYPRGTKELKSAFHRFQPRHMVEWFEERGVILKTERDGRIFPTTDRSQTIIDCLLNEANRLGVEIRLKQRVQRIQTGFTLALQEETLRCERLILATGSSQEGYTFALSLGHSIQDPVPSLFTFNVPTSSLSVLSGLSLDDISLHFKDAPLSQRGPLLITHFGFSGPAVLKLSATAARYLHQKAYSAELFIDWLPSLTQEQILNTLLRLKSTSPNKSLFLENPFKLPKNLWKLFSDFKPRMNDFSNKELQTLSQKLHSDPYLIEGKTTHKEEFVTCGGITLKEVDFKTMQSKICPGLFFAGEILDIDGITGGFNFQNAWTTGFIAGSSSNTF